MTLSTLLEAGVLACTAYICVVYGMYLALMAVALVESRGRRLETEADDHDTIARSRFLPSVSVLVPAHNEVGGLPDAVRSLLALDYPDFEVIVVSDGSTYGTVEQLREEFELVPVELSSRAVVATEPVEAVFRSDAEPRLVVLDKRGGGKADALNVGLNYCRNRFVCGVDADMVFARDALSRALGAFLSDPARVVGLTSFVEIAENPASALRGVEYRIPDSRPFLLFQTLDYLRAFYNNRIAWSRLGFMLCAVGAFQVWRRELLDELGGWSREFTCEDIELTFRVHRVLQERGEPYRVLCLPDRIGVTEGPDTIGKLVAQRERWQRVILETWWANRRMCLNRRYGRVGMLGMPFYLVSEIVAPAFELVAVATLAGGAALGLVDWWLFALVVLLISLVNSGFSAASLLMVERQSHAYRPTGLVRLLALMPLEILVYRPVLSWARIKGTWRFLRGDKAWHKFERNVRTEPA
ncbi:MAG TPA: glycosyltransferase family 2 protein [Gaiellaceae bacterium]|nr:glycosyltransferase family 2 protein [Gaiellaceae bacterium]